MADVFAHLRRRSEVAERMDTDCADFADYQRCLSDLAQVNVVTLTHRPILSWLQQEARGLRRFSLLDVGCGHGDLLRRIRRWALRHQIDARLEGLDRNPWSIQAAMEATPANAGLGWHVDDVFAFHPDEPFDFIVSSQFTHHLTDAEVIAFLCWQDAVARRGWVIADLHRHWFAYYGFPLLARLARWHRFVRMDGQVSIARSFTVPEWQSLIAAAGITGDVSVTRYVPSRLCVARRCHH
ncbi:MAG TPA: methyltransferase domain-containing protein [Acetobacteraceae bacterium]|nr:methyltransferase domain-containing protein [Acetobacteraceae bacterium]